MTHRGLETSERQRFVAACCSEFKELVKTLGIEEESSYLVGDPNTEGSATAAGSAAVRAVDTQSADGLLFEILFVVSFEKSMSIQSPGVLAVWTGFAFEKGEPPVALLLGSENPHRHEAVPRDPKSQTQRKSNRAEIAHFVGGVKKGGGVQARYDRIF